MAIDYSALLGLAAGIQVAKADYDFARDGGAQYAHACNSAIIPAGSIILGWATYTTIAITYATSGQLQFQLNASVVVAADDTLGNITVGWPNSATAKVLAQDLPIDAYISGSAITAGAATVWIFYLPT